MPNRKDPLVDVLTTQSDMGFPQTDEYLVTYVGTTPEGFGLFRRRENDGWYTYHSTQDHPSSFVWDQKEGNLMSVFAALNDLGEGETLWRHMGAVFGYET
jgi:hypothetical protein